MTTSGNTSFNPQQQALAREVLERVIALDPDEAMENNIVVMVKNTMNYILKAWQNDHAFLHTREWVQQTFSDSDEVDGTDGEIYTCVLSHTSSSANKPITGANYSTYWSLKGDTGGTWATSTAYSSIGDFTPDSDTIDIEQAFIRDGENDYNVKVVTLDFLKTIMDKDNSGRPFYLAFDKQLTPKCYLYYQPDSTDYVLHYLRVRRIEDFYAISNTADLRPEHLEALICATAYKMSHKFHIPLNERAILKADAMESFRSMKNGDDLQPLCLKGAF